MRGQYPVRIEKLDSGYLVEAGCLRLSFDSGEALLGELAKWMADPMAVEQEYGRRFSVPAPAIRYHDEGGAETIMGIDRSAYGRPPRTHERNADRDGCDSEPERPRGIAIPTTAPPVSTGPRNR